MKRTRVFPVVPPLLAAAALMLGACNGPSETDDPADTADTDVSDTDVVDTDVADTDLSDTDAPDTDLGDTDTSDTDGVDTDVVDTDVSDTDALDTDVSDTDVVDTDVSDTDIAMTVNYAFITSTPYNGNLGGLAGADQKCQDAADAASLPGTYVALLSTNGVDATSRLGSAAGWVRPDGKFVASDVADLNDGLNYYPLRVNEFGGTVVKRLVWTGDSAGTSNCADWTDSLGTGIFPQLGEASAIGFGYRNHVTISGCAANQPLMCFGVDHTLTLEPPEPVTGRIAFLSQAFPVGGGLAAADAQCQLEADNAGIGGGRTFLAALATTTASIRSRFDTNGLPWVRVDGVPLAPTAAAFFDDDYWQTAANMLADGSQYGGSPRVWSGAQDMDSVGLNTCGNWTATTGQANISDAMVNTALLDVPASMQMLECNLTFAGLLCMEE